MTTHEITISLDRYNELIRKELVLQHFETSHEIGEYIGDAEKTRLFRLADGSMCPPVMKKDDDF